VIESHLQVVEAMLLSWRKVEGRVKVDQDTKVVKGGINDDAELRDVQPGEGSVLWMSYRDWLKLMVAHLDAIIIIHIHVCGNCFLYMGLSIQVLSPPPVSLELLPWKTLL